MSKKEIVVLVSRAIALLQMIAASVDFLSSLPFQIYYRYQEWLQSENFPSIHVAWMPLIATAVRISAFLLIAKLFWDGGPTIERFLSPSPQESEQSNLTSTA